jgi:hypothetical protein
MNGRASVVVMGKLPRPGRVKTRLAQRLGPEAAAAFYRASLEDVFDLVDQAKRLAWQEGLAVDCKFSCALEPSDALAAAAAIAPSGWAVVAQAGRDLGERIESARAAGGGPAVVIGSDAPAMRPERIAGALRAITSDPALGAVVGPTEDGGYDLIAFPGPRPVLLSGIPWSTPEVMAATRAAARGAGLRLTELEPGYDVDRPADLERLARDPTPGAPRSRALLASLGVGPPWG